MKIAGKGVYVDSNGEKHFLEGYATVPDSKTWKKLDVSGKVSVDEISCDKVEIGGKCKGQTLSVSNIFVSGDFKVDSVKAEESFKVSGRVKSKNLDAENITINSRESTIDQIKCDTIKIFNNDDSIDGGLFSIIFGKEISRVKNNSRIHIKKISAKKVDLENCEVEEIDCTDAIINSNCAIKKLTVEGNCDIAADSKVGELIRG